MQELLTGKKRLPGFSEEWETKRLDAVADIDPENLGGATLPDYTFNYISLEDVDVGSLRSYSEQTFGSAPSRARRRLRTGDILVSTVRPNLQSHLLFASKQPNWVCSTGFSVVRCRSQEADPGYVYHHMFGHCVAKQIEAVLTGSNYPAINGRDVKALEIPMPKLHEQTAIASILSAMDAEIVLLEAQLAKYRQIKQGMMQNLLTGRIRLI
jgi:type I restriction enzyme S subunit